MCCVLVLDLLLEAFLPFLRRRLRTVAKPIWTRMSIWARRFYVIHYRVNWSSRGVRPHGKNVQNKINNKLRARIGSQDYLNWDGWVGGVCADVWIVCVSMCGYV